MAFLDEAGLYALIKAQKGGKIEDIAGPFYFGGARIWEVWVYVADDDEFFTRFVLEQSGNPLYFDSFGTLTFHVNALYSAATQTAGAFDLTRIKEMADLERKKITLYVGAFVFATTVLAMLFVIVFRNEPSQSLIVLTLLGVISSGCALFFGNWIPIGRKALSSSMDDDAEQVSPTNKPSRRGRRSRGASLAAEATRTNIGT